MASPTQWTWVCMNSGSWWTGSPGMLWFMGSQTAEHDWVNWTELNWMLKESVWELPLILIRAASLIFCNENTAICLRPIINTFYLLTIRRRYTHTELVKYQKYLFKFKIMESDQNIYSNRCISHGFRNLNAIFLLNSLAEFIKMILKLRNLITL